MPKKLSIPKLWRIKHKSSNKKMNVKISKNNVILTKGKFVYKIRKEGNKYIKVRKDGRKEIIYDLTKTELRKFSKKLDKFFSKIKPTI